MATTQDLHYRVTVNDAALDRLIAKTNLAGQSFIGTANALKPLDAQLRALGRRTTEVGRYLTRTFTQPMLLAAAASAKLGYDFDKSLSRIQTLGGATAGEMAGVRKEVLALSGSTLTGGPKALADALYFIRSSGFGAAEAMNVLTASNQGAMIGMGDITTVADAVTSAMNAYGHETLSASRTVDIFAKTVKEGKAEPAELARSIGYVIPIAAQMGVKLSEVGGEIAALTLTGLHAAPAITGLRALLITFTRGLPITKKALAEIGLTIAQVQNAIKTQGLAPTLNEIRRRMDEFDKSGGKFAQQTLKAFKDGGEKGERAFLKAQAAAGNTAASIASQLFPNVRALNAFYATTGKNAQQAANAISSVTDSAGYTQAKFDEIRKQNWARFTETFNKLRTELTKIGEDALPSFTKLLDVVLALTKAFSFDWAGKWKPLLSPLRNTVILLGLTLAALGPVLRLSGALIRLSSVYVLRRESGAAKAAAASAREAAALDAVAVATTRAADTASLAAAATVTGVDAATAAYARETLAVEALTIAQARGMRTAAETAIKGFGGTTIRRDPATGRFVKEAAVEAEAAVPKVGRLAGAMVGLRGAAIGAGIALRAAFAWAWPILVIEGAYELYRNWDLVSTAIFRADQNLHKFVDDLPGASALHGLKDLFDKQPGWLKTIEKATGAAVAGPVVVGIGLANKHGKELANSTKEVAKQQSAATKAAVEFAKMHGISVKEANQIFGLFAGTAKTLKDAKRVFEDAFGTLQGDLMTAFSARTDQMLSNFDAATDEMIKKMRVKVRVLNKSFTISASGLTPAERELKALEKADDLRKARRSLGEGRELLAEAMAIGSPTAIAEAQQQIQDAQTDISKQGLATRAEVERKAADQALSDREKAIRKSRDRLRSQLEAERTLEQRHLENRLKSLQKQLEDRRITLAVFNRKLRGLMGEYGVTASDGAALIGKAFGTQITESLADLEKVIGRYATKLGNHEKEIAAIAEKTAKRVVAAKGTVAAAVKAMEKALGPTLGGLIPEGAKFAFPEGYGGGAGGTYTPQSGQGGRVSSIARQAARSPGASASSFHLQGEREPYDCSAFTQAVFRQAGISIGGNTYSQFASGRNVKRAMLQPDDLIFFNYPGEVSPGHVGIYVGNGMMVHDHGASRGVSYQPVDWAHYVGARCYIKSHLHVEQGYGGGGGGAPSTPRQLAAAGAPSARALAAATGQSSATGPRALATSRARARSIRGIPNWLQGEAHQTLRQYAQGLVSYSQAVHRGGMTRKQIMATRMKPLLSTLSAAQRRKLGPGGLETYLGRMAAIESDPYRTGLVRRHGFDQPITLGRGGLSGNPTQNVTINVFESGNPRRTAIVVRNELQKHATRNAISPRGRNANQKIGAR